MQFPDDALHRPALNMKRPTHPRYRIHSLQLPLHPLTRNGWSDETQGGSKLDADYPSNGVSFARRNTSGLVLFQGAYNLVFDKSAAFHLWYFRLGHSLSQTGLDAGGNVTPPRELVANRGQNGKLRTVRP